MEEKNPGQQNIAYDAASNQPRLSVDVTYDDDTSLDDIKQKYVDVGDQYNAFVQDARQNVHDRQVEHIGNDFGTSPYNTNTYYEPAATSFASAMRQQGTQQALTVGMERGKKEAEANLEAAKNAYNNAATAYQKAYDNYNQTKNKPTTATIDEETLGKYGLTKEEFASLVQSKGSEAAAMNAVVEKFGLTNDVKDWDIRGYRDVATDKTLAEFGKDRNWYNTASEDEKKEFWARDDVGRYWSNQYAMKYYTEEYGERYASNWQYNYNEYKTVIDNLLKFQQGQIQWAENLLATSITPEGANGDYNADYLDVLTSERPADNPESEDANSRVKASRTNGQEVTFTIDGQTYTATEVEAKMKQYYGDNYDFKSEWNKTQSHASYDKSDTKVKNDILEAFGRTDQSPALTRYHTIVSANELAEAVFGVDINSLKGYIDFKNKDPEKYELIKDSVTRALTDLSVFEIADGKKQFHTKDGWKVLDAGTVVTHVPEAVLNDAGEIDDPDLKKIIELYGEGEDPTVNQEERLKLIQQYGLEYAKTMAAAVALTKSSTDRDETVDAAIYRAVLSSRGKLNNDVKIVNGKTAKELVEDFENKRRENGDEAFKYFSNLMYNAYKNNGGFMSKGKDGEIGMTNLTDKNGQNTVGQASQQMEDKDQTDSMAELVILMNSIEKYRNGDKDGNIDPSFFENDGSGWWDTTARSFWENIATDVDMLSGMMTGVISWLGDAMTGGQIAQAHSDDIGEYLSIIGENAGVLGLSGNKNMKELVSGEVTKDSMNYDMKINNRNSELMRNAINPMSLVLWNIETGGEGNYDSTALGNEHGFGTWEGLKDFGSSVVAFGAAEVAEALAGGLIIKGLQAAGTAGKTALKSGISAAANKLTLSAWRQSIKNMSKEAISMAVADLANPTDEAAEGLAKSAGKEVLEDAAKNSDDLLRASKIALEESTDDMVKAISYAANHVDDYGEFGAKFAEKVMSQISDASIKKNLINNGAKRVTNAMIQQTRESLTATLVELGANAGRQTYQTALASIFTGVSTEAAAGASSEVLTYVSKLIGEGLDTDLAKGFGKMMTGKHAMDLDTVKKTLGELLEASSKASKAGISFGKADAVRFLAGKGWESKRLALVASRIGKELAEDTIHDVVRGYTMPGIDAEGNTTRVPLDEYFSNPANMLLPLSITAARLFVGGKIRNVQAARLSKAIEKTERALGSTANTTPEYMKLTEKLNKLTVKAQKNADKMLDKSLTYNKMKEVAAEGAKIEQQYIDGFYQRLGIVQNKADEYANLARKAAEQGDYESQAKWLSMKARAADEAQFSESIVRSYMVRNSMDVYRRLGNGKPGTLSTLTDNTMWLKIQRVADDTASKYTKVLNDDVRLKTKAAKQMKMRKLQVDAVVDALRASDGSIPITDLREGMTELFAVYDEVAQQMVKDGVIKDSQIRLGYLSETAMRVGKPGDDVPWYAKGGFLGTDSGNAIALDSPDPMKSREVKLSKFLDAIERGEKEITQEFKQPDGTTKTKTIPVNPDGVNMMYGVIAYCNSNKLHRLDGAIFGGGGVDFGTASLRNNYAVVHGSEHTSRAAKADLAVFTQEMTDIENAAKAKLTEEQAKKINVIKKNAQKQLKKLGESGSEAMQSLDNAEKRVVNVQAMKNSVTKQLTEGARPAKARTFAQIFDAEYTTSNGTVKKLDLEKAERKAIEAVKEDIKALQSGADLKKTDVNYTRMIADAAANNGSFTYDTVVYRAMLDNPGFIHKDRMTFEPVGGTQLKLFGDNYEPLPYYQDVTSKELNDVIGKNYPKYNYEGKNYDLKTLDLRNPKQAEVIWAFYKDNLELKSPKNKDGQPTAATKRMISDVLATTKTQLQAGMQGDDTPIGIGKVYQTLVQNLPDKEAFKAAEQSGLTRVTNSITRDGMSLADWRAALSLMVRESLLSEEPIGKTSLYERGRALALVDEMTMNSQRFAGAGEFDASFEWGDEAGIYGQSPDVQYLGSAENDSAISRGKQYYVNKYNLNEYQQMDLENSKLTQAVDLNDPTQVKEAMEALTNVTKELQESNWNSKLRSTIDNNLSTVKSSVTETADALYKSGTSPEYNTLVRQVAQDRVAREIDSGAYTPYNNAIKGKKAAARTTIRQQFIDNARPENSDLLVALGVAREGSVISQAQNLAEFNAAEIRMREGTPNQMYDVSTYTPAGRMTKPAAISELLSDQYLMNNAYELAGYEDAINLIGGTVSGKVKQYANAINTLAYFGGEVTEDAKNAMFWAETFYGSSDFAGTSVGFNTPETALYQTLSNVNKNTYFPNGGPEIVDNPAQAAKLNKVKKPDTIEATVNSETRRYGVQRVAPNLYGEEPMGVEPIHKMTNEKGEYSGAIYLTNEKGEFIDPSVFNDISEQDEKAADKILSRIEEIKRDNAENEQTSMTSMTENAFESNRSDDAELERIYDQMDKAREFENSKGGVSKNELEQIYANSREYAYNKYLAENEQAGAPSREALKKQLEQLESEEKGANSKKAKAEDAKVVTESDANKIKSKAQKKIKKLMAEADDWQSMMDAETFEKYNTLKNLKQNAEDVISGNKKIYHSRNGATYVAEGARFQNYVKLQDAMSKYGHQPNMKPGKEGLVEIEMPEENYDKMRKQIKKSKVHSRGDYFRKADDNPVAAPDVLDSKSAQLTVGHMIEFWNQINKTASNGTFIDNSDIWVDSSLVDIMVRYGDSPLDPGKAAEVARKVSDASQLIQNAQLAGGFGNVNALSLGYLRAAMLESPWKIPKLIKTFVDCRNNKAWRASVQQNLPLLEMMTMETGDPSIMTDLMPAFSGRANVDDGGVTMALTSKLLNHLDSEYRANNRIPKGFWSNVRDDMKIFFEDPTFVTTLPVMRAQMLCMNYDSALSKLKKKFAKDIGNGISAEEIQKAAIEAAYAKTMKFWMPEKFFQANYKAGLQKIHNQQVRRMVGNITGEGTPVTFLDVATNAFFALRYKQSYVNRTGEGIFDLAAMPFRGIKNKVTGANALEAATAKIANSGSAQGFASMIGLAVLAKVWCDAMGIPNAWSDFTFEPQDGDEKFHMPSVLMKFQNAGQFWIPNAIDENGMPTVDPNKKAFKVDPFFSMFTLPNTVNKSVDRFFNGDTNRYSAPQGGLGFLTNMLGADWYGANSFFNSQQVRALTDELIGANLLSPFKALHEVVTNSTYFGNNIWERKYLSDGTENPNYDPQRNITASIMHIMGLDKVLDPNGYNRWVKGAAVSETALGKALGGDGTKYKKQDQVGTITGSGILQHEYLTAAMALVDGDLAEALVEGCELPIKREKLSSKARTDLNNTVKNSLAHFANDYKAAIKNASNVDEKDKAFAEYTKKSADVVAKWSKKYGYLLGENQNLVSSATRLLMAMTAGEYDDRLAYVQNAYWKASQMAQIEASNAGEYWLDDADVEAMLASGMTAEEVAAEKEKRTIAYNKALDDEYDAREALKKANVPEEWFTKYAYEDLRAESRRISAKIYQGIVSKLDNQVGEFKNFKEMKAYYESQISAASTTKQKAKLANKYNEYVFEVIAPYVKEYGAAILTDTTYNSKGIAQRLSDYIIVPADKYYNGKSPRTSYMRDYFGVGYNNRKNMPSDQEVAEKFARASKLVNEGKSASASAIMQELIDSIKKGTTYASDIDYSKIIRLQSKLRSKQ